MQYLEFVVAGPEDLSKWKGIDDGSIQDVVKGNFVVVEGNEVLVDTRFDTSGISYKSEAGVVAWYDANLDGYYELGFIFTAKSWTDKIAVAVYLSKNGSQRIYTNQSEFLTSNDELVAAHWLSKDCAKYLPRTDIWNIGYQNSLTEFRKYIQSDIYRNNLIADGVAQFVIGVIGGFIGVATGVAVGSFVSTFASPVVGGIVGTVITTAVSTAIIMGLNVIYQTTIKTALN